MISFEIEHHLFVFFLQMNFSQNVMKLKTESSQSGSGYSTDKIETLTRINANKMQKSILREKKTKKTRDE